LFISTSTGNRGVGGITMEKDIKKLKPVLVSGVSQETINKKNKLGLSWVFLINRGIKAIEQEQDLLKNFWGAKK